MKAEFFQLDAVDRDRCAQTGQLYQEFLRIPGMSAGIYVLPAGGKDSQRPHNEDEMYYVVRGRACFRADGQDREVSGGSIIFVAAHVEHCFYDIHEEIAALVFFAPAET